MSLQLKVCLIASTSNTISQDIEVPILICPSNASSNIALYLGVAMITHNHPYHPIFLYFTSPKKVHPCLNDVSDHSNSSITITTKYATFTNILKGIVEMYNIKTIPNTTGSQFKKPIHHHLSHRYYLRDHRIVYHHQSTYLFIPNVYHIDQNSHSQFITLFVPPLHLHEFKPLITIKLL